MNPLTTPRVSPMMLAIFRLLNYIEVVALFGTAAGSAMLYTGMGEAPEVLMISLSALSGVFFLKGYQPPQAAPERSDSEPKLGFFDLLGGTILPKVGWMGCAVTTVGILFRLLNLKGSAEMLMIGTSVLVVGLLLAGIFIVSKPERSSGLMPLVYRAVPVCLVGVYLFMTRPV